MSFALQKRHLAHRARTDLNNSSRPTYVHRLIDEARALTERDGVTVQNARHTVRHYTDNDTRPVAASFSIDNDLYCVNRDGHIVKTSTMAYIGNASTVTAELNQITQMGESYREHHLGLRGDFTPGSAEHDYQGQLIGQSYHACRHPAQLLTRLNDAMETLHGRAANNAKNGPALAINT